MNGLNNYDITGRE